MIYRPAPITEIKAQTIESIIRKEILATRTSKKDDYLPTVADEGLKPGEGKRVAIKRQIGRLERKRNKLSKELIKREMSLTNLLASSRSIDAMLIDEVDIV